MLILSVDSLTSDFRVGQAAGAGPDREAALLRLLCDGVVRGAAPGLGAPAAAHRPALAGAVPRDRGAFKFRGFRTSVEMQGRVEDEPREEVRRVVTRDIVVWCSVFMRRETSICANLLLFLATIFLLVRLRLLLFEVVLLAGKRLYFQLSRSHSEVGEVPRNQHELHKQH